MPQRFFTATTMVSFVLLDPADTLIVEAPSPVATS
jgi:hypothetical protein